MKTLEAVGSGTDLQTVLSAVEGDGEQVILTRGGIPVARVLPVPSRSHSIFGFYKGKLEIKGDIVAPLYTDEEIEEFLQRSAEQVK